MRCAANLTTDESLLPSPPLVAPTPAGGYWGLNGLTMIAEATQQLLGPGIHYGVESSIYHAIDACSNSRLNVLSHRSAKHLRYAIDNPEDPTPAQIIGDAVHVAVLQPDLFDKHFVRADRCSARKKDNVPCSNPGKFLVGGDWLCGVHVKGDRYAAVFAAEATRLQDEGYKLVRESQFGSRYYHRLDSPLLRLSDHAPNARGLAQIVAGDFVSIRVDLPPYGNDDSRGVLSPDDYEKVMAIVESVGTDPHASELLAQAEHREASAVWRLQNGLVCKGRFDGLGIAARLLLDLKTTDDASPAFERKLDEFGYARQAAMYLWGCATLGITIERFHFIAIEKEPPYAVGVHSLNEESIDLAADELNALLDTYRECEITNNWPGYEPRIARLPAWAIKRIETAVAAAR